MNTRLFASLLRITLVLALALGGIALIRPLTAYAATITVTKIADTNDGACNADCSLREAIAAAASGDTIVFANDLAGQTITLDSQLDITKDLTIDGSGLNTHIKISGNLTVRVFNIDASANAILSHLDIINGNTGSEENGGGIYNAGNLLLQSSTVSGCKAKFLGGGISNDGTLTVQNSTISNNSGPFYNAFGAGGGIYNAGTLLLENSTLLGNFNYIGGGIANAPFSMATLRNSTLAANLSFFSGGGIDNMGVLTMDNNTLYGNGSLSPSLGVGGGGVSNTGTLNYTNNIIATNTPGGDCLNDSDSGGTINTNRNNLVGDGSCSDNAINFLTGDPMLALMADNGGPTWTKALLPGSPAIDAGDNAACPATDQRGMPRPFPVGGACDIGAYEIGALRLSATASPATDVPYHGVVTYTLALSNAGGIQDPAVWLTDTLPAAVAFESWIISPTNTTLNGSEIRWNGPLDPGQAVTLTFRVNQVSEYGQQVINQALFRGASDSGSGQASFEVECIPVYTVQNGNDDGAGSLRYAITGVCPGGTILFSGDTSIYLNRELKIAKNLTIDGEDHAITISGDTGNNGTPNTRVFVISASSVVNLRHINIVMGIAFQDSGGGIVNKGSLTLQNSSISNCLAEIVAGGIDNTGTLTVTNSAISGNNGWYGSGGIRNDRGTLTIQNSTISGNFTGSMVVTGGSGGGISNNRGTLMIQNSTVSGNMAAYGGGIDNYKGALTVQNSMFSGNSAVANGGGIYNMGSTAQASLINVTVSGNIADSDNASTVTDNGGGIYNSSSATLSLQNTIVAGNENKGAPVSADCQNNATLVSQGHNLVGNGSGCPSDGAGDLITNDPLLGSLADNGGPTWTKALLPGSPAIDAGDNAACPATDQRGMPRPFPAGGTCDIGAYEIGALRLSATASPATDVPYHDVVTYTLALSNAGGIQDPAVWLTDTLPAEVAFESWIISPTHTTLNGSEIRWNGPLDPGQAVTFTFQARHIGNESNQVVINRALYSSSFDRGSGEANFEVGCTPVYSVQNGNDDGAGSLRQAITAVCPGGKVIFNGDTNVYLNRELIVTNRLTIDGEDHAVAISGDSGNDGSPNVRVFEVAPAGVITLSHVTIISGTAASQEYNIGGGIYNEGLVTLLHSTLTDNSANTGGAIFNNGVVVMQNTAVAGNVAESGGGGIYNQGALTVTNSTLTNNLASSATIGTGGGFQSSMGTALFTNCTFSGNQAKGTEDAGGGGIMIYDGTVTLIHNTIAGNHSASAGGGISIYPLSETALLQLSNTIVAENTATGGNSDISGVVVISQDYNLIQDAPNVEFTGETAHDILGVAALLGPLADNGGATWTRALLPGSPAMDVIPAANCTVPTDQRGFPRPYPAGGKCDIGAYEWTAIQVYLPVILRNVGVGR